MIRYCLNNHIIFKQKSSHKSLDAKANIFELQPCIMLEEIKEEGEQQPEKAPTPEEIGLSGGDDPAGNILYDMQKSVFKRNKLLLTGNNL